MLNEAGKTMKVDRKGPPEACTLVGRPGRHSVILAVLVSALGAGPAFAQRGAPGGEWVSYAGDDGGTKYSPLSQIDSGNSTDLELAWRWVPNDASLS